MAKQRTIQLYRGTAAQNNLTTGLVGEVTYDTTNKKLRVHDGATEGGFPIAKDAEVIHITGTENIAGGKTFTDNIYAPTAAPGTNTTQVATTAFVQAAGGLQLGETSTTAYRGDRGKTAYDHSQLTSGNPHNVTKTDLGLENVDNTSDANKPISTATQTALNAKANDNEVVHKTGDETIADIKTFTSSPIVPTPLTNFQAATKKYVDDNIGGGGGAYPQNYISQSLFSLHPSRNNFSMYGLSAAGAYNASTSSFNFTNSLTEYISINKMFTPGSAAWEIIVPITPTNFAASGFIMSGYNNNIDFQGFALCFNTTGKVGVYLSSNGSSWNLANNAAGTFIYTAGTKYWIKLAFSGSAYTVTYSTDGTNFNSDYSLSSSTTLYQTNSYNIAFGINTTDSIAFLGTIFMNGISYKISTVEQLSLWTQNNASSLIFESYSARGILNTNNINTAAMTKLINTNWSAGTGNGAFVPYSTYTAFATGKKYSLFMVTNGTINDIVAISSTAHTNGVLVAGAVTAINTAMSTTITDYRYIGECWANDYTTPYLKKYTKQYNGFVVYDSSDNTKHYEQRADKYIIQTGYIDGIGATGTNITLPVAMRDINYNITFGYYLNSPTGQYIYVRAITSNSVFQLKGTGTITRTFWRVEGYAE